MFKCGFKSELIVLVYGRPGQAHKLCVCGLQIAGLIKTLSNSLCPAVYLLSLGASMSEQGNGTSTPNAVCLYLFCAQCGPYLADGRNGSKSIGKTEKFLLEQKPRSQEISSPSFIFKHE